jgi:hypothetical protein
VPSSYRPVTMKDIIGIDFGYVMQPFDAVCGYTFFHWDDASALAEAIKVTQNTISLMTAKLKSSKKIIYTFWITDVDINKPLPLQYPDAEQIISISKEALRLGVRHIDFYGYRIGDWRVYATLGDKAKPGANPNYPIIPPLAQRFLCDRHEVLNQLKQQLPALKNSITN